MEPTNNTSHEVAADEMILDVGPAAVEALIEHLTYTNTSTDPAPTRLVSIQVSDGQGGASAPRSIEINVTPQVDGASPLFGEQQVNTYETNEQHVPVTVGAKLTTALHWFGSVPWTMFAGHVSVHGTQTPVTACSTHPNECRTAAPHGLAGTRAPNGGTPLHFA